MRFEDWVEKLDDEAKELGRKIIAHNNARGGAHNGMMVLSDVTAFHESNYHYTVATFDAYCGQVCESASYPLGDYRWTVDREICIRRYNEALNKVK